MKYELKCRPADKQSPCQKANASGINHPRDVGIHDDPEKGSKRPLSQTVTNFL